MKKFTTVFLFLLSTLLFAQQTSKHELIDSLLQESHRRGIFNGNALVVQNNINIYNGAVGFADASQSHLLKPEMRFVIGSISKEFDGVGIMILKEQGKLQLSDPLADYFPELPQWAERIRIKHLLQYTSGLISPIMILCAQMLKYGSI